MRRRRRADAGLLGPLLLAAGLAACSSGPLELALPTPDGQAAVACAALADALPAQVGGAERREVSPVSALTAAWGEPPTTLRCGVEEPAAYEPTSLLTVVDEVAWLPVEDDEGTTFYATGRAAWVELRVPVEAGSPAGALVAVGAAVSAAVPPTTG